MKDGQNYLVHITGDIPGIWRQAEFSKEYNSVIGKTFLFHVELVTNYIDLEKLEIVPNPLFKEVKQSRYKYKLNDLLSKMSKSNEKKAKREICELLKISERTLHKWRYTLSDNEHLIAAEHILKMADYFDCSPKELYTNF